jgi:hypothetical protein
MNKGIGSPEIDADVEGEKAEKPVERIYCHGWRPPRGGLEGERHYTMQVPS